RGMFVEASAMSSRNSAPSKPAERPKELPSALRLVNLANRRLQGLLLNLHNETGARDKLLEVASALVYAVNIDSDVALATILLNQ
ncbi:hypothetical protein Q0M54_14400, partial [Staphylococcus aureus]|nr:hypothetical protein [Staphylococcus aureus]